MTPSADSLRLSLDVPREARAGAPVPMALRVENAAARPLDLYLRGRTIAFDLVVERADGRPIWRRLEGEMVPAIVQLRTLAPGEVLELRARWNGRTARGAPAPGDYVVRGLLLTDGPDPLATPAAPLRILPP